MAAMLGDFAACGLLNIVGGCCGTTPEHIAAIAAGGALRLPRAPHSRRASVPPERPRAPRDHARQRTSSTSASAPTSPVQRAVLALIKEGRYDEAVEVARQQVESGAQVIDINMDEGMLDSERRCALPGLIASPNRTSPRAGDDRLVQVGGASRPA
jgi:5-methyltetrahydrofolate--homocysteine methyltransferase